MRSRLGIGNRVATRGCESRGGISRFAEEAVARRWEPARGLAAIFSQSPHSERWAESKICRLLSLEKMQSSRQMTADLVNGESWEGC